MSSDVLIWTSKTSADDRRKSSRWEFRRPLKTLTASSTRRREDTLSAGHARGFPRRGTPADRGRLLLRPRVAEIPAQLAKFLAGETRPGEVVNDHVGKQSGFHGDDLPGGRGGRPAPSTRCAPSPLRTTYSAWKGSPSCITPTVGQAVSRARHSDGLLSEGTGHERDRLSRCALGPRPRPGRHEGDRRVSRV